MQMEALNDEWHRTSEGHGHGGTPQSEAARAAHNTITARRSTQTGTNLAADALEMSIAETPPHLTWQRAATEDWQRATQVEGTGHHQHAYTDGSTLDGETGHPRAGWGLVITHEPHTKRYHTRRHGKLQGPQENAAAEAQAALQALTSINICDECTIYIDNAGVIQNTMKERWNRPRERLKMGHRPTWNRIENMINRRKEHGTPTHIRWVHSHVDDERRRLVSEKSPL